MEKRFAEQGRNLSEGDIENYCSAISSPIPDDFRSFLLEYNGGRPHPEYFEIADHPEGIGDVDGFYSIDSKTKGWDLTLVYLSEKGYLLDRHIPIGNSSGGDIITMSLAEKDFGSIWWRDNAAWWKKKSEKETFFKLANDFSEFLESLIEWKWDE